MKVSIVKCYTYNQPEVDEAVKKSLALISFKIPKNKKILLKPNLLGFFQERSQIAITTNIAIIKAVIKLFQGNKLYLGDSSGQGDTNKTIKSLKLDTLKDIEIINFDKEPKIKINFNGKYLKEEYIPKILKEVDLIINLPKLKTHSATKYTGAIKNFYGILPGGKKWELHHTVGNDPEFSKMLLEIFKTIKPNLSIMDGIIGMEGDGPSMGRPKNSNVILASEDSLSLDYIASKLMGFDPLEVPQIKLAYEENLNSEITVLGEKNLSLSYLPPSTSTRGLLKFLPPFIRKKIFDNKKLAVLPDKCKKCGLCAKVCPVNAISYHPYPVWDFKKCIRCHCCMETCPYHAIHLKENPFFKTAFKIFRKIKNFRIGNSGTIYKN